MRRYGPYVLAQNVPQDIQLPGSSTALAAILFVNYSAFTLQVDGLPGMTPFMSPQTADILYVPEGVVWDGTLRITPLLDLTISPGISTILRLATFGAGEPIYGNYPAAISMPFGGSASLSSITTGLLEFTVPDTWTLQEDISGNLILTDTTTGNVYTHGRTGTLSNGSGAILFTSPASTTAPFSGQLPSAPVSDAAVLRLLVSGDTSPRVQGYIRGSDGYGGLRAGAGSSVAAHLYAQATGWQMDEAIAGVGGQATAGSFGVPLDVAQQVGLHATGLTQAVVTLTAVAGGLYRVSAVVDVLAAATATVTMQLAYTNPTSGAVNQFLLANNGAGLVALNAATIAGAATVHVMSETFRTSAASVTLNFQDTHASPNSVVSAYLERLA